MVGEGASEAGARRSARLLGSAMFGVWLAAAFASGAASAQPADTLDRIKESKEIRLAYRADAAPFSYEQDGKPAGYSVNLCLEVAAALQTDLDLPALTATFVRVTAENRFDAITEGAADLLCEATSATLSRREKMDFSIYTFVSGASVVATHDEGFEKLQKAEISAYFGDRTILEDRLRKLPDRGDLLLAENYLTIEPYALAMPIDHDFRLAVDRALSRLFRTGGLIKVFRKSFDPEAKPSDLVKMLSRVSGLPD